MLNIKISIISMKLLILINLLFAIAFSASAEEIYNNDEWIFLGDVYVWGADIESDTTSGSSMDIPFHTIIDNLDMVLMGTIGAQKGNFLASGD